MFQSTPPRGGRPSRQRQKASTPCFNPRPREGGDTSSGQLREVAQCFNPRPREGGDAPVFVADEVNMVSIHAPARGATMSGAFACRRFCVSIHAPARGATGVLASAGTGDSFNPRPREGGDTLSHAGVAASDVSIHAPARGATISRSRSPCSLRVSIHAPARGATAEHGAHFLHACFNPRPREGGDGLLALVGVVHKFQSTPPRGGRRAAWTTRI